MLGADRTATKERRDRRFLSSRRRSVGSVAAPSRRVALSAATVDAATSSSCRPAGDRTAPGSRWDRRMLGGAVGGPCPRVRGGDGGAVGLDGPSAPDRPPAPGYRPPPSRCHPCASARAETPEYHVQECMP